MDAGQSETSCRHGAHSHLHFVSFPCVASELSRGCAPQKVHEPRESLAAWERVQRFNVVLVLDSRRARRHDPEVGSLWQVSAQLARGLLGEEARTGFLSREVRRLVQQDAALKDTVQKGKRAKRSLERLLLDLYHGVRSARQMCVSPKHEGPPPPTADQALVLTCPREELHEGLPSDSAEVVRCVTERISPTASLGELALLLGLPLATLQRVSQHLVQWKRARVVDAFLPETRLAPASGVDTGPESPVSLRFQEWRKRRKCKLPESWGLPQIFAACGRGRTLADLRGRLPCAPEEFDALLEWLVAEGLLRQLATFLRLLAPRSGGAGRSGTHISEQLRRDFCPQHLNEDQLQLLASRAADEGELLFLCRLAAEYALSHTRTDGCAFASLLASHEQGEAILRKNKDVFVPYTSTC